MLARFLVVVLAVVFGGAGLGSSSQPRSAALLFFKAPSLTALETTADLDFSVPPVSEWTWYEGERGCSLSPIANKIDHVARAIVEKDSGSARIGASRLTTRRNAVGPTLVDSEAIFKGAARLIEEADHEIDIVSFAMEPDSPPYLELVRAFDRRLASPRPIAKPFRIRIYTDHISIMFSGGTARSKARALLVPWLRVFQARGVDPRDVQLEMYVHAHGAFFYHHGGRYSVHDKFMVVDGSYLHIGGANPQAKNNYVHPERDTAVIVKGDVASSAIDAFDGLWSQTDFSCAIERTPTGYGGRCVDRRVPFDVLHSTAIKAPLADRIGLSQDACVPMTLLSKRRAGFQNLAGYSNPWAKGLLAAVVESSQRIALSSPNMNAPPLIGALVDAMARRDVKVDLLFPYERNDPQVNSFGGYGSNALTLRVMNACAVVARTRSEVEYRRLRNNFRVGWWVAEGERQRFAGDGRGCFHTKFASFDDRVVVVGSGNLDDQSFFHSSETSLVIDDAIVTKAVAGFIFEPDWKRSERVNIPALATDPLFTALELPRPFRADAQVVCSGLGYSLK